MINMIKLMRTVVSIRVRKTVQCISKACPNHDNVILSFVLSRSFFFFHFQNTYRNSRVVYTVFTTSDLKIGLLLHKSSL